jgi:hypothetical protein
MSYHPVKLSSPGAWRPGFVHVPLVQIMYRSAVPASKKTLLIGHKNKSVNVVYENYRCLWHGSWTDGSFRMPQVVAHIVTTALSKVNLNSTTNT